MIHVNLRSSGQGEWCTAGGEILSFVYWHELYSLPCDNFCVMSIGIWTGLNITINSPGPIPYYMIQQDDSTMYGVRESIEKKHVHIGQSLDF